MAHTSVTYNCMTIQRAGSNDTDRDFARTEVLQPTHVPLPRTWVFGTRTGNCVRCMLTRLTKARGEDREAPSCMLGQHDAPGQRVGVRDAGLCCWRVREHRVGRPAMAARPVSQLSRPSTAYTAVDVAPSDGGVPTRRKHKPEIFDPP